MDFRPPSVPVLDPDGAGTTLVSGIAPVFLPPSAPGAAAVGAVGVVVGAGESVELEQPANARVRARTQPDRARNLRVVCMIFLSRCKGFLKNNNWGGFDNVTFDPVETGSNVTFHMARKGSVLPAAFEPCLNARRRRIDGGIRDAAAICLWHFQFGSRRRYCGAFRTV